MNTTLPRHVDELATQVGETMTQVGETMTDVMSKGMERARDLLTAAEERIPERASDWTREHVPGLSPRRTTHRRRTALIAVLVAACVAGLVWWLRRPVDDLSEHLADDGTVRSESPRASGRAA